MTGQSRVFSFANPRRGLAGNVCHLHVGDQAPTTWANSEEYHCYIWPWEAECYQVRCYFSGLLVQCCGHGLLAAAATLFRMTGRSTARLAMNGTVMEAEQKPGSDIVWVEFPAAEIQREGSAELKSCMSAIAGLPGLKTAHLADMATSGDEEGYLVVRLPDGFDLTCISPPGQALAKTTRRALIVTSLLDRAGSIGLRYFAPQYGVEEDAATGSAMRVLAGYWADRFDQLTATQYSPAGGELFSTISGTTTRIGGRVVTAE